MGYTQKDNSGVAFNNERKERDSQPDITGKGMIFGKEVSIAMWKNTSKNGKPYLAWKVGEPYRKTEDQPAPSSQQDKQEQSNEIYEPF